MSKKTKWPGGKLLLELADLLYGLKRKRFYYGTFVGDDWGGKANLSCGTTACALGWATTMPKLRKKGLRLNRDEFAWHGGYVEMNGLDGAGAATEAFDVGYEDACYLFYPETRHSSSISLPVSPKEKATPKQVAKHIRRFVAWKQKQLEAA